MKTPKKSTIAIFIISFLGIYFIVAGMISNSMVSNTPHEKIEATIINVETKSDYNRTSEKFEHSITYTYEYTYEGQTYTAEKTRNGTKASYEVGDVRTIVISTENPERMLNNDGNANIAIGVFFLIISAIVFAVTKSMDKKK